MTVLMRLKHSDGGCCTQMISDGGRFTHFILAHLLQLISFYSHTLHQLYVFHSSAREIYNVSSFDLFHVVITCASSNLV